MKVSNTIFFNKVQKAQEVSHPFVIYRPPGVNGVRGVFQQNDRIHYTGHYEESGFVFAPFDSNNKSVLFPINESLFFEASKFDGKNRSNDCVNKKPVNVLKNAHLELVQNGIDLIKKTDLKKIVLSRIETVACGHFDPLYVFEKILNSYSDALCYLWVHPKIGMWLGASPETLLTIKDDRFETMALAGTLEFKGSLDVKWNLKERNEQELVTQEIEKRLSNLNIPFEVSNTQTIRAANLVHLKTAIFGTLPAEFHIEDLIQSLHPTPAVCGSPRADAKSFILANENYNRAYYTGFLGELNLNRSTELYVNLRCMERKKDVVQIYVGGGITEASDPENEWKETVAKCQVMLQVL